MQRELATNLVTANMKKVETECKAEKQLDLTVNITDSTLDPLHGKGWL